MYDTQTNERKDEEKIVVNQKFWPLSSESKVPLPTN